MSGRDGECLCVDMCGEYVVILLCSIRNLF